ncbi:LysR family transcriptional regulator [Pseudomonas sp.]|uniref:LysR family transcriptional regulator n=1 Tax=Pseudomonas sp. TaxID=306 RepID=UPI0028A798BE|nr:LysR family transcriptional regulator [Pseudomonas sp.]
MDIRALRYFVAVVDQQSFTRAATQLHLTQPTVSKMVQLLEESFGVPLLAREGKRFSVTDAGQIVYQRAREMMAVHERMRREVEALHKVEYGVLRMGLSPSTHSILAPVFAAYHAAYPGIELKLFEIGSNDTLGHLREGVLEMGTLLDFAGAGDLWSEFEALPLFESPLCLLAPSDSPWRGRDSVALNELANSEFILYGDAFALNDMVQAACTDAGFTPKVSGRSGQWDFMASLVSLGVGIALLPKVFCDTLEADRFTVAQVRSPALNWKVSLAWRREGHLSFAAKAWLGLAREMLLKG